jgi:hypothetical protein
VKLIPHLPPECTVDISFLLLFHILTSAEEFPNKIMEKQLNVKFTSLFYPMFIRSGK